MRKVSIVGYIMITMLLACKNNMKTEATVAMQDTVVTEEPVPPIAGDCYMIVMGKDSILMQMVIENTSVGGQLYYRFYEKDKSGGTLFGEMRGDTMIADYKFIAEGLESEREVAFLRRGDEFIEGYGDVEEKDGRTVFKNIAALRFEGQPMHKTDCAALSWYFTKK